MSTISGEGSPEKRAIEEVALDGLHLVQAGDYGEQFQRILDMTGAGLSGQIPSPEGLILKALYHQSRGEHAVQREDSSLQEIVEIYKSGNGPETTPIVISGLAIALSRAKRPEEQLLIADALEAGAENIKQVGYSSL